MCNLYSQTKSQDAMGQVFNDIAWNGEDDEDLVGNLEPMAGIFPDYAAPILRRGPQGGWQLTKARWGMPTPAVFLEGKRADPGVTNIRKVASSHRKR
jgi:putative SOS response-associated peptidase YedK